MNRKGLTVEGIKDFIAGHILRIAILLLAIGIGSGSAAFASPPAVHEWEAKAMGQQVPPAQVLPLNGRSLAELSIDQPSVSADCR